MRYPTLRRDTFVFELRTFFGPGSEQDNSASEREPAEQRRNENVLLFIRGGVNRAHIENLFPVRIGETLISQGQATENDEENANQDHRFHVICAGG